MFIVQAKPREASGHYRHTRSDALQTARRFLDQGFSFVAIIGDGRVYTVEEFAPTASAQKERRR